ncbi:AsmA family protein [Dongia sp. agr-C8]
MRIKRLLTGAAIVVVGGAAAVFAILQSVDFNSYKDLVAQQVKAATGRDLVLAGDVKVAISLIPHLEIDQVSFRNADWGSEPQMLKLEKLEADVALIPLLSSQIQIKQVRLVGADILLETNKDGLGNWVMGTPTTGGSSSAPLPQISQVAIENAKLRWHNGVTGKTRTFAVDKLTMAPSDAIGNLAIAIDGKVDTMPISLKGITGTLANFTQGPLPINATGQIAGGDLAVKGEVEDPASLKGINLELTLAGKAASDLGALFEAKLPPLGAYQLRTKIANPDGKFVFDGLAGKVGGTDFTGRIEVDPAKTPVAINANLASSHLDLADFGVKPDAQKSASPGDGKVFSAEPWDLTPLQDLDGQFHLNVQRAILGATTLDNLVGEGTLQSGALKITTLTAGLGDGTLGLAANVNGAAKPATVEARLRANNVDGAPLLDAMGMGGAVTAGRINLEAAVQGPGTSLRDLMAGWNGGLHLEMGSGAINNDFARLMFADLFQLVTFGGTANAAKVNCMVTDFAAVDGIAGAKSLVLDTPGVTVVGTGDINLRDETLHLHFDSNSKQTNLANLAVPINVGGTLAHPAVSPDAMGAVGNTADFAARTANTATFGVLSSLTGVGASSGSGDNPCVGAAAAGAKAKQSSVPSAGDKIIDGLNTTGEGIGQGAQELGEDALDATKKAGEAAGQAIDDLGKSLFGN